MKKYVTIGKAHGTKTWTVIMGPETPAMAQRQFVRAIRKSKAHEKFGEVWVCVPIRRLHANQKPILAIDKSSPPPLQSPEAKKAPAKKAPVKKAKPAKAEEIPQPGPIPAPADQKPSVIKSLFARSGA